MSCMFGGGYPRGNPPNWDDEPTTDDSENGGVSSSGENEVAMTIMTIISLLGGLILSGLLFWKLKEWGIINIFALFEEKGLWGLGLIFLCFLIIPTVLFVIGIIIFKKIGWV